MAAKLSGECGNRPNPFSIGCLTYSTNKLRQLLVYRGLHLTSSFDGARSAAAGADIHKHGLKFREKQPQRQNWNDDPKHSKKCGFDPIIGFGFELLRMRHSSSLIFPSLNGGTCFGEFFRCARTWWRRRRRLFYRYAETARTIDLNLSTGTP